MSRPNQPGSNWDPNVLGARIKLCLSLDALAGTPNGTKLQSITDRVGGNVFQVVGTGGVYRTNLFDNGPVCLDLYNGGATAALDTTGPIATFLNGGGVSFSVVKVSQWLGHSLNYDWAWGSSSSGSHFLQARVSATADYRDVAARSGGATTIRTSTELCIETPQVQIWNVDAAGNMAFWRDGTLEFSGAVPTPGLACDHFSIGGAVNGGAVSNNGYERLFTEYVIAGALSADETKNFGWWLARQYP